MEETEKYAISRIINAEIVLQHFGYWPDFHDAEVIKVTFEAHPTWRYSVTFVITALEMVNELDERGYYKQTKHCQIELQFSRIQEMEFDYFNYQNVISILSFEDQGSCIKAVFNSSAGMKATIIAEEALVISLTPTTPIPDEPREEVLIGEPMDAKNIFISSQHRLKDLDWSDLIYVGLDHEQANDYKAEKVAEYAHQLFDESEVYVVIGRHDSHLSTLDEALNEISTLLKETDVLLCNTSFTKAMQFNKIGVMSYGQKRN